jgi:ATP-dependent Lhr-like helicase
LTRAQYAAVLTMLAEGFSSRRGRRGANIHYDAVNGRLRGRRGARLTALTSGGTIPDTADYQVLLEPEQQMIGTVNEDFAVESLTGDVFQLGNTAYRILRVERGVVRVEDARGAAPTIPFWLGEAPGRSDELSQSLSRLRAGIAERLTCGPDGAGALAWLREAGIEEAAALELVEYFAGAHSALGCLPTQRAIVLERFFDEAGGMQLVIHSPYGSRVNRAWGLALRKRFCRKFNFELQAAATEDNIVLSLTTAHSFELAAVGRYLNASTVREVLVQALLDAPMFITRWRWVAAVSLALPRFRGGKKVPPQLARMAAEDLVAAVFPDCLACAENLPGEREVPDHPLVNQAVADCLHEAMDVQGLERLLAGIEAGSIRLIARDLTEPSPLALEVLAARPYAYLDDAPLEERRTQAVLSRRWLDPEAASDLGRLDPEAIARVRAEAWPEPQNRDELHDALTWLGYASEEEAAAGKWQAWLAELAQERRAATLTGPGGRLWIAAERQPQFKALWPAGDLDPELAPPAALAERAWSRPEAIVELLRGRLEGEGPVSERALGGALGLADGEREAALGVLEAEGFAMRGRFTANAREDEWCERRLLARINRYTVKRLRAEIEPVAARDFLRFLFDWQHVAEEAQVEGLQSLQALVAQLEGFEAPASAWESEILPARVAGYDPAWLDELCLTGAITWSRLRAGSQRGEAGVLRAGPVRSTPIALLPRRHLHIWSCLSAPATPPRPGPRGERVAAFLGAHGASFFDDIVAGTGLLRSEVEDALAELVALALARSDSFGGLRALLTPAEQRRRAIGRRRSPHAGMEQGGRWTLVRRGEAQPDPGALEHVAHTLLKRYGVVFWRMLERESGWLPPWRDLVRIYRKLESRGEIRGGRFVAGVTGEQFALPEAVAALRQKRRQERAGSWVSISGADPLNMLGVLTPGPRLPALTGNRLLYRDGVAVAALVAGEILWLEEVDGAQQWDARDRLLRSSSARPSRRAPRRVVPAA